VGIDIPKSLGASTSAGAAFVMGSILEFALVW